MIHLFITIITGRLFTFLSRTKNIWFITRARLY